jgi:hypothetical protein
MEKLYRDVDRKGGRNYTGRKKEIWIEREWQAQAKKKAQKCHKIASY